MKIEKVFDSESGSPAILGYEEVQNLLHAGCTEPDCKHDHSQLMLIVHCKKHPQAPSWVCFKHGKDTAAVVCSQCNTPIIFLRLHKPNPDQISLNE
jgi:hypothetical protein